MPGRPSTRCWPRLAEQPPSAPRSRAATPDRLLAEIGLRAGGPFGFALAGGHAVAAHGIIDRPSEDVDLFADWQRRADFPTAVDAVIAAYEGEGFDVMVAYGPEILSATGVRP